MLTVRVGEVCEVLKRCGQCPELE